MRLPDFIKPQGVAIEVRTFRGPTFQCWLTFQSCLLSSRGAFQADVAPHVAQRQVWAIHISVMRKCRRHELSGDRPDVLLSFPCILRDRLLTRPHCSI